MGTTLTLIMIALMVGVILGHKAGRIVALVALIGAAVWVLVNLPKIVDVIEKARAIADVMGW